MKHVFLGLCGPARVGKTTLANHLVTSTLHRAGLFGAVVSMASPVKEAALSLGWNGLKDANGRKLLQLLGTDIGRNLIDQDIWVSKWLDTVSRHPASVIIADDVRFDNEALAMRKLANHVGAKCAIVELYGRTEYSHDHASECGISDSNIDWRVDTSDWDGAIGMDEWATRFMKELLSDG